MGKAITVAEWKRLTGLPVPPDGKPKRRNKPVMVPNTISAGWVLTLELPFATVSEANRRDHWTVRNRRKKEQQQEVHWALSQVGLSAWRPPLPVRVTLTRQGSRLLDSDNLAGSFKFIQDALADWMQIDDGDRESVEWIYDQTPGIAGTFIRIEPGRKS